MDKGPEMTQTLISQPPPPNNARLYSMQALRSALNQDHKPLLEFAATKEFSAENILFLTRVRAWRSAWSTAAANLPSPTQIPPATLKHLFNTAVDIYIDLIDEATAEFAINIDFSTRKALDSLFQAAAFERGGYTRRTSNKFDFSTSFTRMKAVRADTSDSERTLFDNSEVITMVGLPKDTETQNVVTAEPMQQEAEVVIPPEFTQEVFDSAAKSIEYLVLTNTWPKFVKYYGIQQE